MSRFFADVAAWEAAGIRFVIVTIVATAGSSPREAGAKLAVSEKSALGSVGGGQLEWTAIRIARAMLEAGDRVPLVKSIALGPAVGQCCGGQVALLFEPFDPTRFHLTLFGAGHVAKALVLKLGDLPGWIDWIDPRDAEFPEDIPPRVRKSVVGDPVKQVASIPRDGLALVMTHSHDLDYALIAELLRRPEIRFVGLIGSMSKRARFEHRLRQAGFDQATCDRLICPIGIEGIDGKDPGTIAIAVAAQILMALPAVEKETSSPEQWARWRQIENT